jgi:hypothetical protein
MSGMPNQPKTTERAILIPDELWRDALRVAESRGESVSDAVRRLLSRYVKRHDEKQA